MTSEPIPEILATLDKLSGGVHPGHRPVHARGVMLAGTFTPTPAAATLTRAPHATRASSAITARFSIAPGVPSAAENNPAGTGPQGLAVRFHLGEHEHTDIVAHSANGFPARTGEEFLEFVQAAAASGPGAPNPPPIAEYLATHPAALRYVQMPKPIPESYARQNYFGVTAFEFTNGDGVRQFGRFRIVPDAGTAFLTPEDAATKPADFLTAELSARHAKGPVAFRILVQMAQDGDDVTDSTTVWPETRPEIEFGTLTFTELVDGLIPEQQKIIFDPIPRVDGIGSAGDPLSEVRSEIYLMSGRRRRQAAAAAE